MESLFEKFKSFKVLIIGDVMIDAYLNGSVSRISPEAPVPIVEIKDRSYRLGGAANVALNIKALGAEPVLCSVIGNDGKSELYTKLLEENGLRNDGILMSENRKTTVKYRIIGNKSQMLRIDEEIVSELSQPDEVAFISKIKELIENEGIDIVIFEDYDKGVITPEVISEVVAAAKRRGISVTVDPKKRNFSRYAGVDLFKPNFKELCEGIGVSNEAFSLENIKKIMSDFSKKMNIKKIMTTLSERGIAIYDADKDSFFSQPAFLRHISDVSGAGDTVISVASLCLAAGLPYDSLAVISNLAGGIVCEYAGVVPINADILQQHVKKESDINTIL